MSYLKYYTILLLCMFAAQAMAQPAQQWYTAHNGTAEESHGHFIMSCSDGGFLQIGETGFIPNSAKLLVVKTDANGSLLWKKEFGSRGHNLGNAAYELGDGYLICGALNQNSTLIKLNKSNGSTIFNKTYDNGGSDAFEHVAETPTGLMAVGYIRAEDSNNTFYTEGQGYLTLLDNAGNKVNGININNYTSHAYRIKAHDGALLVSGLSAGAERYNLLKFNYSGGLIWNKNYGGDGNNHCFGMDINANGEIFLTGHTTVGTENWDTYTMKINGNGEQIWETKKGNPRGFNPLYVHDEAWGIKATPDGGCLVVAGSGDEYESYSSCNTNGCSDVWRVYLIKYDANGRVEWQQTYFADNAVDWAGEDVDLTGDGGAIVAVDDGTFGFLKIAPFSSPLSVELTSFQVEIYEQNAALMSWTTASEVGVSTFYIEYSTDLTDWKYLDEIEATGSGQQGATYTFVDEAARANSNDEAVIYYRLRWTDADGSIDYSDLRSIQFGVTSTHIINRLLDVQAFPNPMRDQLMLSDIPARSTYRLFSADGILRSEGVFQKGSNSLTTSELDTGIYYLTIQYQQHQTQLLLTKI